MIIESLSLAIIQAFIDIIKQQDKSIFPDHFQSLSQLDENLEKLESEKNVDIANTIMDWCKDYDNIIPTLREVMNQKKIKQDIVTDEEQIPSNINHQNEGQMINNKFLVRQTIQTALKQQTPTADSENNE